MKKITANLIVDDVKSALPFWVDRLGFTKTVEVPDGDGLGFVILVRDKLELMLQSQASLAKDVPAIATGKDRSVLYLEVESLDPIRTALAGWPRIIDERTTFYGARELIVEAPSGHVVFFAVHG